LGFNFWVIGFGFGTGLKKVGLKELTNPWLFLRVLGKVFLKVKVFSINFG